MANKKSHLSYEERFCIEKMLRANLSITTISGALNRGISTITQEINKNGGKGNYVALKAQNTVNSKQHKKKQKYNKVLLNEAVKDYVNRYLKEGLSPEAISLLLEKEPELEYVSSKSIRKYFKNNKDKI